MNDERLKILLIEDDVGDVRLIRELVGGALRTFKPTSSSGDTGGRTEGRLRLRLRLGRRSP